MISSKLFKEFNNLIDNARELSALLHSKLGVISQFEILNNSGTYYKPKYFTAMELVPEFIYNQYQESSFIFMDVRILWTIDSIREYFNESVIINTYKWGGNLHYRGFRPPSYDFGAELSQHKFGRAVDFDIKDISSSEVRSEILSHKDEPSFQYITSMEKNVNWVHIDCRNVENRIFLFGGKS